MKHSEFVLRMKQLKNETERSRNSRPGNERNPALVKQEIESTYVSHIQDLINALNVCDANEDEKRNKIIKCIQDANRWFFNAKGLMTHGQVLFTRHGESATLWQKALGLNPNAPISSAAQHNMEHTSESTQHLLFNTQTPPRIAISPMTRALQTAGLLIPKSLRNADISIEPALSENSISPSGCDIRSVRDHEELRSRISFLRSPIKAILFFLSRWIFGEGTFAAAKVQRAQAITSIQEHNRSESIIGADGEVKQNMHLPQYQKISQTMRLITESQDRDLWLIGHGNNFRSFFKSTFDLEVSFDYAETHSVFKMCGQNTPEFFAPPYSFYINQSTGKIEGKFSGEARFVHAQDLSPLPTNVHVHPSVRNPRPTHAHSHSHSYHTMHQNGLNWEPRAERRHKEGLNPLSSSIRVQRNTTQQVRPDLGLDAPLDPRVRQAKGSYKNFTI